MQRMMVVNPLMGTGNYSATSNNMKLVHWPLMGGLLHLVQRGEDWAGPSSHTTLLAVGLPNVTVHPSTASVPITVLLYNGPLLCGFDVPLEWLTVCFSSRTPLITVDRICGVMAVRLWWQTDINYGLKPSHGRMHLRKDMWCGIISAVTTS